MPHKQLFNLKNFQRNLKKKNSWWAKPPYHNNKKDKKHGS